MPSARSVNDRSHGRDRAGALLLSAALVCAGTIVQVEERREADDRWHRPLARRAAP